MTLRSPLIPLMVGLASAMACGEESPVASPQGGTSGSGGSAAAAAGTAAAGGASAGGTVVGSGSGGSPSAGTGAMAASGAAGGPGGAAGAPASLCVAGDCTAAVGALEDFFYEYPGGDCVMVGNTPTLTVTKQLTIKGDPTQVYQIDFYLRGILESKNYVGGMRRSAAAIDPGPAGQDLWYEGGTAPVSSYSSYELHVTPPVDGAPNDYFLNARDGSDEHDAKTWAVKYNASIKVMGGGTVTFKTYDNNCVAIKNCGPSGPCTPRTFELSDSVPPPPADAAQPIAVQWLHIDVTDVKAL